MRSFATEEIRDMQELQGKLNVKIRIQGTEIIHRRNKYNLPCNENWKHDDKMIIDKLISNIGCKPQYWVNWTTNEDIKLCKSQKEYAAFRVPPVHQIDLNFLEKFSSPCREIQTIISTTTTKVIISHDNRNQTINNMQLDIRFSNTRYKEIRNVRSFDEESLIGNLGGYIGLFLGVAIWQAPDVVLPITNKLKKMVYRS